MHTATQTHTQARAYTINSNPKFEMIHNSHTTATATTITNASTTIGQEICNNVKLQTNKIMYFFFSSSSSFVNLRLCPNHFDIIILLNIFPSISIKPNPLEAKWSKYFDEYNRKYYLNVDLFLLSIGLVLDPNFMACFLQFTSFLDYCSECRIIVCLPSSIQNAFIPQYCSPHSNIFLQHAKRPATFSKLINV